MKKLVKSAKQYFEERLESLTLIKKYEFGGLYYACENEYGMFVLLQTHDGFYGDIELPMSYHNYIQSEEFLCEITHLFWDTNREIKPIFKWYNSTDKANEPFNLMDIWNINIEYFNDRFRQYYDIYEEIPDNVVTAEQQFEEESKNAKEILPFLKVEQTSSNIIFYQNDKGDYYRFCYPSLEVMRKDKDFVFQMIKVMTNDFTKEDLSTFMNWVDEGGEFPFPLSVILSMEYYQDSSCYMYEDKEESLESLIRLTPEQKKAVDMIEEGVKMLRNSGGLLISYQDDDEWFAVNGNGIEYMAFSEEPNKEPYIQYKDVTEIVAKQLISFGADVYWDSCACMCAKKL